VAAEYFRSGADKVSIGSDAVLTVEQGLRTGRMTGKAPSSRSRASTATRPWSSPSTRAGSMWMPRRTPTMVSRPPSGAERRALVLVPVHHQGRSRGPGRGCRGPWPRSASNSGAGEILLNCIDRDGTNAGFDLELINAVRAAVTIPVIASSGAGCEAHFVEVFTRTEPSPPWPPVSFHRREVPILFGYAKPP
jgi:glutamine amidotransferase/cyclase